MPRYVILEHDHPELHWDLMLEAGAVLRTWRLAAPPRAGERVHAEPSFDHRPLYLDYEGPVSGDRGTVKAWDRGTYEPALAGSAAEAADVLVTVTGARLRGTTALRRDESGAWWLHFSEGG
jgi:hypothetical protein